MTCVASGPVIRAVANGDGSTVTSLNPARSARSSRRRIATASHRMRRSQRRWPSSTTIVESMSSRRCSLARSSLRAGPERPVMSMRCIIAPLGNVAIRVGVIGDPNSARTRTRASTAASSSWRSDRQFGRGGDASVDVSAQADAADRPNRESRDRLRHPCGTWRSPEPSPGRARRADGDPQVRVRCRGRPDSIDSGRGCELHQPFGSVDQQRRTRRCAGLGSGAPRRDRSLGSATSPTRRSPDRRVSAPRSSARPPITMMFTPTDAPDAAMSASRSNTTSTDSGGSVRRTRATSPIRRTRSGRSVSSRSCDPLEQFAMDRLDERFDRR